MNTNLQTSPVTSDEELCRLSRDGDRDSFGRIVERYQTLVCSLAYSACGNFSGSEDLAQETFVAAWRQIAELREPGKLRAWLCGIVRNLSASAARRTLRRGGEPESLEFAAEQSSASNDPAAETAEREEQSLLWRTLGDMPETYREPLILFYREEQSVAEVAQQLDLTEDAVKQRLSRGRAMLKEEVTALIESTLTRTRPTAAFTAGVLAAVPLMVALPATSASAAAGVSAGKGAAAAGKGALAALGMAPIVGPVIGLFIGFFSSKAVSLTARSPQERKCISRHGRRIVLFCWLMSIGLALTLSQAGKLYPVSPGWLMLGICAWVAALVLVILVMSSRMHREVVRVRAETGTDDVAYSEKLAAHGLKLNVPKRYESKLRCLGLPLFAFAYGGYDADSYQSRMACGWLAFGDQALSPLLAVGGIAIAPIAIGGITVGIFSLSLWGMAVGGLALGSIAIGWYAFGMGAAGWKAAAGVVAIAQDYAVGVIARAAVANTQAAKAWFASQWSMEIVKLFLHQAHWWILFCAVLALGLVARRAWQLRRLSR